MNINEMPAGREMDALVAEKVMGWKNVKMGRDDYGGEPAPREYNPRPEFSDEHVIWREVPPYSTDIAAAWMVVEKLQKPDWAWHFDSVYIKGKLMWFVTFWGDVNGELITDAVSEEETLPLAICRAALMAVGIT